FDELTGVAEKERVMRFYKDCIRRHLYFHGPEKRFLSKNPAFSAKVGALREYFPGARLICNVRSPYNTVPSLFSALYVAWDMFDNDPTGDVFRNSVLEIAAHWYRHPLIQEHNWPDNRFAFLTYDALVNDLEAAVLGLYQRLEINAGPHFAERLRLEHESARKYKSSHRYSLEKYGLTSEGILNDFGDIFQRFGFDTANPADTEVRRQEAQ
ncbi:MAG TPA: sulfotransferase, partial [Candidatus Hydrogenedentes bacterium]|nr:sulfotransferase [Candidatus Hydrogenedentota bacterium]